MVGAPLLIVQPSGLAKHVPNTASGSRVTGAGPHTASRLIPACRQIPQGGAVCGKAARTGSVRSAHSIMRPCRDLYLPVCWSIANNPNANKTR